MKVETFPIKRSTSSANKCKPSFAVAGGFINDIFSLDYRLNFVCRAMRKSLKAKATGYNEMPVQRQRGVASKRNEKKRG